ncbi:MAG: DNA helicase RecQ [Pseudomonadota bacterium]
MTDPLAAAKACLSQTFGFDSFRSSQEPVVAALLSGRDVLAIMPTGAGKSLCFQVPALVMGGLTVVVSPLVALMEDQVAALRLHGIAAETINSGRDRETNVASWRRVAAGQVRLLYLSPERLMSERMIAAMQSLAPAMFAIDEAHCISRWGAAFRPEYEQLSMLKTLFPRARLAAFTATADPATRDDIAAQVFDRPAEIFVAGFDRPNIHLGAETRGRWQDQVLAFLASRPDESGIIYCLSRKNVDAVTEHLRRAGINALPYHAGMLTEDRARNQDRFMTENPVVMVATIAFGMGIDKPDIRFVLHTHLPGNVEAYYQEIGRAGRDGSPADALLLFGLDDIRLRRRFIDEDGAGAGHKRREHKRLDALVAYAEASSCRRVMLLGYFGEESEPCGNCDLCIDPPVMSDATSEARMALSAIARTGERFGQSHIIDVLRGSENQKITELGHNRLEAHGAGRGREKPWWQAFLRQLVSSGHLTLDIQGYGGLSITQSGHEILDGTSGFSCKELATKKRASRAVRPSAGASEPPDLDPEDTALLAALKAHRLEIARGRGVPPYVIFHDRTLIAMASARPADKTAFLKIHGVGASKAEKFADSFISIVLSHSAQQIP